MKLIKGTQEARENPAPIPCLRLQQAAGCAWHPPKASVQSLDLAPDVRWPLGLPGLGRQVPFRSQAAGGRPFV